MQDGQEAGRSRRVQASGRSGSTQGSGSKRTTKTVKVTLHLGEETYKRLGIHAVCVQRDKSNVAEEILGKWLRRFGRLGSELSVSPESEGDDAPPVQ